MDYKITKTECESRLEGKVCSRCGKPIEAIKTVDNSNDLTYWSGCLECGKFDEGVSPIIYKTARLMVEKYRYVEYSHMDPPYDREDSYKEHWKRAQTGGAAGTVGLVLCCLKEIEEEGITQKKGGS